MSVTLDDVVQGLGRPDEDNRGGFTHGDPGYHDWVAAREMGADTRVKSCPVQRPNARPTATRTPHT